MEWSNNDLWVQSVFPLFTQLSLFAFLGQHTVRWSIMNKDKHWLGLTWQSRVSSGITLVCWWGLSYFPSHVFCSAFLFSAVRRKAFTHSSPPLQLRGVHQTRWQPSPAQRRGSFCSFNSIQHVVVPLRPSSSPIMAVSFIMRPIKKDLIEWGATTTIQ